MVARRTYLTGGQGSHHQDEAPGSVQVRRAFRRGDVVELHLPVAPRFTVADPRIDAVRGCVAVERGPEVLCLESVDLAAAAGGRPPRQAGDTVLVRLRVTPEASGPWPYAAPSSGPGDDPDGPAFDVPLVAYPDWAERGPSTMRAWLPARSFTSP